MTVSLVNRSFDQGQMIDSPRRLCLNNLVMEKKVIQLIADVLQVPISEITLETEIGELDEWDSLRNITIIAELQKQFGFTITQDMLMDLETVADIISLAEDLAQ